MARLVNPQKDLALYMCTTRMKSPEKGDRLLDMCTLFFNWICFVYVAWRERERERGREREAYILVCCPIMLKLCYTFVEYLGTSRCLATYFVLYNVIFSFIHAHKILVRNCISLLTECNNRTVVRTL